MGLAKWFKRLFRRRRSRYIPEEITRIESQLTKATRKITPQPVDWYRLEKKADGASVKVNLFQPKRQERITRMAEYQAERKRQEEQRKKALRDKVSLLRAELGKSIDGENLAEAEKLLLQLKQTIEVAKDPMIDLLGVDKLEQRVAELRKVVAEREEEARRQRAIQQEKEREEREERERKEREEQERREAERRAEEARQAAQRRARAEALAREAAEKEAAEQRERTRLSSLASDRKPDAEEILAYLRNHGVRRFYHFTSIDNIASIKRKGGLFSWSYCNGHNISMLNKGDYSLSRSLDRRWGLEDYVRLSFCDDHPMAFHQKKAGDILVLLEIDIEVAAFAGTRFTDINATANGFRIGGDLSALQNVDINATKQHFVSRDSDYFATHQAEVLVKTHVPLEYITNIDHPRSL